MHSYQPKLSSPSHSEWSLISSLKQKQYEQALKMQKFIEHQKKQAFRHQLENQLKMKQHGDLRQKSQDKAYYDFISNKTREDQNKSLQQKHQKYLTRKQMDQNNRRKQFQQLQATSHSRIKSDQLQGQQKYVIGFRNQASIKAQQQVRKQTMFNQIQHQLRTKQMVKKQQRINQIDDFHKNLQYQDQLSKSHQNKNKFRQNEKVYEYYSNIHQQKQDQKNKLQYQFVDKPLMNKIQSEDLINKRKSHEEYMRKQQVKDALDQQIDQHRVKQMIQRHPKPQQVSYSFFGNMFDQASKGYGQYDKKDYNQYLQRQIAQQRLNKKKFQFMDQREYLYNINQINKALNGTYLKDTYLDYSMTNVGEKLNMDTRKLQGQNRKSQNIENPETQSIMKQNYQQHQDQKQIRTNLEELLKKNTLSKTASVSQNLSPVSNRKSIH